MRRFSCVILSFKIAYFFEKGLIFKVNVYSISYITGNTAEARETFLTACIIDLNIVCHICKKDAYVCVI